MDSQYDTDSETDRRNVTSIKYLFKNNWLQDFRKITTTLQGSIWRCTTESKTNLVTKITNRQLHQQGCVVLNGKTYGVAENIIKEQKILKYLSSFENVPNSMVKFVAFGKSKRNYYLAMTDGGPHSLFDFCVKAHQLIALGQLSIARWHKAVKIIFAQIVECMAFLHSKNVSHFDISLENVCLNDVDVSVADDGQIDIRSEEIQCKVCDFGLAEIFGANSDFTTDKFCGKVCYKSPEIIKRQTFNAQKNDIWCMGTCLFMLLVGGHPWEKACPSDEGYRAIMTKDGIKNTLRNWDKLHYVNVAAIELLESIFTSEGKRATIAQIQKSKFLC